MKLVVSLSFLVLAAACESGAPGGGGGPVPAEELGGELGRASCDRWAACCTAEEFMDQTLGAQTEEECVDLYAGLLDSLLIPPLLDSIEQGRVVYHADRMGTCIELVRTLSCTQLAELNDSGSPWGAECQDPFEGQVGADGACANDWDCVSEYCSGDATDFEGNITFGVCITAPTEGLPCDDFECADGFFCDSSGKVPTCLALLVDGSNCELEDECASGACEGGFCGAPTVCDGV